jgi:hypothetical protein
LIIKLFIKSNTILFFVSVKFGSLFYNYKTLLEIGKKEEEEEEVSERAITNEIRLLTANKPHGKILLTEPAKSGRD